MAKIKTMDVTKWLVLLLSCVLLSACASATDGKKDPYEDYNRTMFKINTKVDKYTVKPVAVVYEKVFPSFARTGISNFFSNLGQIPDIGNDLLQGEFYRATADTWRFMINSTVGLLGFVDVAKHMGLPNHTQDFGLTLAKWGVKKSPYMVLPLLGPSTVRDSIGTSIDYFWFDPLHTLSTRKQYILLGTRIVNTRSQFLGAPDRLVEQAFDPYVFVRNAYLQRREALVNRKLTWAEITTKTPGLTGSDKVESAQYSTAEGEYDPAKDPEAQKEKKEKVETNANTDTKTETKTDTKTN